MALENCPCLLALVPLSMATLRRAASIALHIDTGLCDQWDPATLILRSPDPYLGSNERASHPTHRLGSSNEPLTGRARAVRGGLDPQMEILPVDSSSGSCMGLLTCRNFCALGDESARRHEVALLDRADAKIIARTSGGSIVLRAWPAASGLKSRRRHVSPCLVSQQLYPQGF